MAISKRINFRLSDEMAAELTKRAKKDGTSEAVCARKILSQALGCGDVEELPKTGRPKKSEKP